MKSLACRLCFVLPIAAFGVFVLWIIGGIFSNVLGAGSNFYCTVYCKAAVGLLILAVAAAAFIQVRACFKAPGNTPQEYNNS